MASLMNGLSAFGAGVSAFAGTAGLEQQKANLATQQAVLADQMATVRETAGRAQAGDIAATAAGVQQTFMAGQNTQQQAATAALETQKEKSATGDVVLSGQIAGAAADKLQAFEFAKAKLLASLPTPATKEVVEYSGAQPGTPEFQAASDRYALVKAGISPDLYGSTAPTSGGSGKVTPAPGGAASGSGGAAPAPGPRVTAADGSAVPQPAATGLAPSGGNASTAYKPSAPGLDSGAPSGGYNEAVLAGKPAWLVAQVHAINEGRQEPPGPRSLTEAKSPEFAVNALLNQYNPNFDATLYPTRLEAQKAIAPGGSLFTSISAMNTSMGHVEHLDGLYSQLHDQVVAGGLNPINTAVNTFAAATGHYPVINEIKQTVNAMAEEGNRIYAGNAGTQSAIDKWADSFPLNGSLADQQGALKNFSQLMGAKFETLAAQVNAAAGYPGKPPVELLTPAAKATYLKQIAPATPAASIPPWVKPGDQYSPFRGQARGADGVTYGAPQ
jgi:hypothetical protein